MGTGLWTVFIFLSVEEQGITILDTNFRANPCTWFCALVYSLSLFHVLPPVSMFFLCSFFFIGILFAVFRVAGVSVEVDVMSYLLFGACDVVCCRCGGLTKGLRF